MSSSIGQFAQSALQPIQNAAGSLTNDFSHSAIGNALQGNWGQVLPSIGNELGGIATGKIPVSFGAEVEDAPYPKATAYLQKNLDPEGAQHIMNFVNHVQTKGPRTPYPDSPIIQGIANDVFGGQAASTWSNSKLAKAFDTVLGNISQRVNKAGLSK